MAEVIVAHHPELTADRAMEVFRSHFGDRYDVHLPTFMQRVFAGRPHFVVRKSAWAAVGVWLKQKDNTTSFVFFTAVTPSAVVLGVFVGGVGVLITYLLAWIMLRSSWKAMEEEVRSLIENATEFN